MRLSDLNKNDIQIEEIELYPNSGNFCLVGNLSTIYRKITKFTSILTSVLVDLLEGKDI